MSLTLKSGRPPIPSQPPARARNNTFAFFPPTVSTHRHTDTQWGHRPGVRRHGHRPETTPGSHPQGQDHCWCLLLPSPEQHLTGVASHQQHPLPWTMFGKQPVNTGGVLTMGDHGGIWRWSLISGTFLNVCQPVNREHSMVLNVNHLGSRET